MFKLRKLNQRGFDHVVVPVAIVVIFALVGSYFLFTSLAATPQWKGTLQVYSNNSGYCLTTTGGAEGSYAVLDPCSKTYNADQVWEVNDTRTISSIPNEGSNAKNIQEFTVQSAAGSNECLNDWQQNGTNNWQMRLYPCSTNTAANAWIWETKIGNASPHQLSNLAASRISITGSRPKGVVNMCLDDNKGSHATNTKVDVYECKTPSQGPSNQEWFEDTAPAQTTTTTTPPNSGTPVSTTPSSGSGSSSSSSSSSSSAATTGGCTSGGAAAPCIGSATTGASGWALAFDDEFNGTSLNTSVWNPNGWTNNNMSSGSKASYVTESGGDLILQSGGSNSGAQVETSATADALAVGDVAEARVEFKGPGSGAGTSIYNWPAWWVSGPNWPAAGESDIAESYNGSLTVNYHSPSGAHNGPAQSQKMSNAFHTYTIERFSNKCEVWWDGQLIRTYSTDDNGQPENLIFTNGNGNTTQTGAAGEMLVDYVRVWKP